MAATHNLPLLDPTLKQENGRFENIDLASLLFIVIQTGPPAMKRGAQPARRQDAQAAPLKKAAVLVYAR